MQILFEKDVEGMDYFEIVLTEKEYDSMEYNGIVKEFNRVFGERDLNVNIRVK